MSRRTRQSRLLRKKRRGIILLITVSLLTLFVLIAVTYALVASVYRDSAITQSHRKLVKDSPQHETDTVFGILMHDGGKNVPNIAVKSHSLLYDMFGEDGFKAVATNVAQSHQNQVVAFDVTLSPVAEQPFGTTALGTLDDAYTGQVITFLTGNAKLNSSRILRYIAPVSGTPGRLYVESFKTDKGTLVVPSNNDKFLVNGRPFNGTGVGYKSSSMNLDETETFGSETELVALLPNHSISAIAANKVTGGDEAYDAPDLQNMFLGFVVRDPSTGAIVSSQLIPSFHRPELIKYWIKKKGVSSFADLSKDLKQRISLRPIVHIDTTTPTNSLNPNFTGSNPTYDVINGPWDVDNDNDGTPDSIWFDPGLPVLTAPNGRLYKRLAAVLILDLESRIDLNAAGDLKLVKPASGTNNYLAETPIGTIYLPRGLGFGPAEIQFQSLFDHNSSTPTQTDVTKTAPEYTAILTGRYGSDGVPGQANRYFWNVKFPNFPADYHQAPSVAAAAGNPSPFMSPPDLHGRGYFALDNAGQPVINNAGGADELDNHPYLSTGASRNIPGEQYYTPAELERLLRPNDLDVGTLPTRLTDLAPSFKTNVRERNLVTTMSSHVPVPTMVVPKEQRGAVTPSGSTIMDLYAARITSASKQAEIDKMLPWEMRLGRKFNLNRLFGNGRDDNNDGVADEISEATTDKANVSVSGQFPTGFANANSWISNGVDVNNSGSIDLTDSLLSRHLYARHLYCLAWATLHPTFSPDFSGYTPSETLTAANANKLFAQRLAQWAVNVVDFRDPDSIMTPFEYDINPANGWSVDGDIQSTSTDNTSTERGLVWGVESPDLLITEAKATHAKRIRDTDLDNGEHKKIGPGVNDDKDADQFRIPQGTLMAEFYCPKQRIRSTGSGTRVSQYPNELYSYDTANNVYLLDLGKTVTQPDNSKMPVWQVVISENLKDSPKKYLSPEELAKSNAKPWSGGFDPAQPDLLDNTKNLVVDRRVWFTNQQPTDALANKTYYNMRNWGTALAPGQYAVIGPRENTYFGSRDRNVTGATIEWGGNSQQYIQLQQNQITVTDLAGSPTTKPVVGLIAEMPPPVGWSQTKRNNNRWRQGVNVTEPLASSVNYYMPEPPDPPVGSTLPDDFYDDLDAPVKTLPDEPFERDGGSNNYPINANVMYESGTYVNCRAMYLQRLADPTKSFDQDTNPYITVDWATIDTTVFNGEDVETFPNPNLNPVRFGTRERGQPAAVGAAGFPNANLWYPLAKVPATSAVTGGANGEYFDYNLVDTLGSLNLALDNTNPKTMTDPENSPFPWLTWNNRPFANPAELLLVPSSSAARMFGEMPALPALNASNSVDPYLPNKLFQPFGHLLNFFNTNKSGAENDAPHFYRLLDLVETPSPYSDAETWFNPTATTGQFGETTASTPVSLFYRPPFNNRSNFREPGRVNINTVSDPKVWEAIAKQYPAIAGTDFFDRLVWSRQGFGISSTPYVMDDQFPTRFVNPFRPANAADLAPLANMRQANGVDATLLRPNPDYKTEPLFAFGAQAAAGTDPNNVYGTTGTAPNQVSRGKYNDTDRNPYFRYQPLQKISNLVTTQSNCFAVWVTIGYFEVDPVTGGLGQEMGTETGEIERHRAFYIIDRSIPVAFEPGENHNVDRAVLLRRMIE